MLAHVILWHPQLNASRKKKVKQVEAEGFYGSLDLRRKAQITQARAADYGDALILVPNDDFDLNATIFANLKGSVQRYIMRKKLAVKMHWNDAFVDEVCSKLDKIPAVVPPDAPLLDFMNNVCDFSCEHADGSFWDHLRFCFDYSAIHFKRHSPRVLLLHSILGVGTNLFPCAAKDIPALEQLVDDVEMSHINAFPSILRLILNGSLLEALRALDRPATELKALTYHRVIDNAPMRLEGEEIWVHLNYHLIHLMDFLPGMDWESNIDDPQLQVFIDWLDYMKQQRKVEAQVDIDVVEGIKSCLDFRYVRLKAKQAVFRKAVSKYSADIGHSLAFQLEF